MCRVEGNQKVRSSACVLYRGNTAVLRASHRHMRPPPQKQGGPREWCSGGDSRQRPSDSSVKCGAAPWKESLAASDDVRKHSLQTPPLPDCPCLWLPSLMSGTYQLSPAFTTQTLPWMGKWDIAIQRVIMPYLATDRS